MPTVPTPPPPNWSDFRLSITRALEDQLVSAFASLTPVPLDTTALAALAAIPAGQGVYRLHYPTPQVAYVGKADDLALRLGQHLRKLGGRTGIVITNVGFTCLSVEEDLTTVAPETVMIRWQQGQPGGSPWNGSGFGSNDPGRRRDTQLPGTFDNAFPINLSYVPTALPTGTFTVRDVLRMLQGATTTPPLLPYSVRAQDKPAATTADYTAASMTLTPGMDTDAIFTAMVAALNAVATAAGTNEWQATALYGRVILYRERPAGGPIQPYPHQLKQW